MNTLTTRTTTVKASRPFGLGLSTGTRLIRSWQVGAVCFDLIEDELWFDRDQHDAWPIRLHWVCNGHAASEGFDSVADAMTMADHLSTPLPCDETTVEPVLPNRLTLSSVALTPEPVCGLSGLWMLPGEDDLSGVDAVAMTIEEWEAQGV